MHVSGFPFDLSPLLPFIVTAILIAIAILHLLKTTASNYFVVDANFKERGQPAAANPESQMIAVAATGDGCAVCGSSTTTRCSGCKRIRYCSITCQSAHWRAGHKLECKELKSFVGQNATVSAYGGRASVYDSKSNKQFPQLEKVLFPYEDFVKLFNWENMRFSPCGLLNCGNSCYANVVLQCLSSTRPLVAYLLEIRHVRKCRRNDWCFLCELEAHVDRARHSCQPFSPINILSRLPNIGGNLGYGKQEDAHEFMRFAIDTMQSVCLDEFGGEKAIHPSSQETTLIQYIFGGQLQSQVKCSKCHKISYRHENMMDLTVEIQGDAESLEKCLDQFTAEEWLDGENMYKCDGCNDYVKACKRLAIHQAPNILTIALKRFQSGRFGKLNKRVTFPETLDLGPYMSEPGCDSDIYRLYAVVVHIDMLNASYFGHYICYVKDFCGHWYRIDDCKVETVELEEVLSQGAYMLLYSRISVRPSCVKSPQICKEENQQVVDMVEEAQPCTAAVESITIDGSVESFNTVGSMPTDVGSPVVVDKQQGKNISEETQTCPPVFESINVVGSVSSLSNMTTDARPPTIKSTEKDDVVCMNVDDSVKVDTRFVEDATTSTVDVLFDSKSSLMDMDLDAPNRLDLLPAGGDEMDIDMGNPDSSSLGVKVDECGTCQSDIAGIVSGGEIFHGEVLGSVPLREATLVKARSLDCDIVSGSNSEDHSLEERSRSRGEVISNEVSSLPQSAICELADSSCSPAVILQGNSSDNTAKPLTRVSAASISEKSTSKPARDKSCSNGKQRPLFSVGFLDKRPKCKPPIRTGAVLAKPGEVGLPCKVSSNCNGITKPVVSQHTNVVHNHNGFSSDDQHGCVVGTDCNGFTKAAARQNIHVAHDHNGVFNSDGQNTPSVVNRTPEKCSSGVQLIEDCIRVSSEADPVNKCSNKTASEAVGSLSSRIGDEKNDTSSKGKQNSLFAAGFLDKRIRCKSPNGDGNIMVKSSDVGVSCKPHSKCNGFTNHSQGINVVHEGNVRSQNGNGSVLVKTGEVGVSCKLDRNCNGMTKPLASQSINMVHDGNGKSEYGNGNVLVKPGEVGASCRLDSDCNGSTEPVASGGIDVVHHGNGTLHSEHQHSPSQCAFIGEVGYSCEGKNTNGFANPGSLPNNTEDHNYDRNFECHNLVKSSKYIGDQCDDTSIDDGEQGDGKRDVCTRDFLNNASRKKFLKKEGPSLSDSPSCNKLPRVG